MPLILPSSQVDRDEGRWDGNILMAGTKSCYVAVQSYKAPNTFSSA